MNNPIALKTKTCAFVCLVLGSFLAAGCGSGPRRAGPVDVELARESLRAALESWKKGEPPEALRDHYPSITIQDMDWKSGYALVSYEIRDGEKEDACNLHCPVRLTVRDLQGKEVKKPVTYVIGTDPVITVFREMSL
jgi:hypothetical protein